VFLLALWVEGKRLGARVVVAFGLLVGLLITGNVVRVAMIVVLAVVLDQPGLADIVHVPVGLIGFLIATGIPLAFLRGVRPGPSARTASPRGPALSGAFASIFVISLLGLAASSSTRPAVAAAPEVLELDLAANWSPEPIALTEAEADLLGRFAAGRVAKLRVHRDGKAAAILLVQSQSWRSHHPPELCLAGAGHRLSEVSERSIAPDFRVRFARLDEGQLLHVSWFQSGSSTHADLVDRIVAQVFGDRAPFVLVSVVLDGFDGPEDPSFSPFLTDLRAEVARIRQEPSS
jgi:exosortase O